MRLWWWRTGVLLAVLVGATRVDARELWERPWLEVQTETFRIVSGLDEKATRAFAANLEDFRGFVMRSAPVAPGSLPVPFTVFLLPGSGATFGLRNDMPGAFQQELRRADLILVGTALPRLEAGMKHALVHLLLDSDRGFADPPWLAEGRAELLATLETEAGRIELGRPTRAQAGWLNVASDLVPVLPFERLLAVDDLGALRRDEPAMFRAQSWLLVHYLMLGRPGADVGGQLTTFRRVLSSGTGPAAAFEESFGIKVVDLRKTLRAYSTKLAIFAGAMPDPYPAAKVAVRALSVDAIATELGWLLITRRRSALAGDFFAAALAQNPRNARALAGQADVHRFRGDLPAAAALYERAISEDPGDPLNELEYAEYFVDLGDRARKAGDAEGSRAAYVEARRRLARSYRLDPTNPETLVVNGTTYLAEGNPGKAVESLETATVLYPGHPEIRTRLVKALVAAGEPDLARRHIWLITSRPHRAPDPAFDRLLAELGYATPAD